MRNVILSLAVALLCLLTGRAYGEISCYSIPECTAIIEDISQSTHDRAWAYYYRHIPQQDYESALADLNEAIRLDPADPVFLEGRVMLRMQYGRDWEEGLADANKLWEELYKAEGGAFYYALRLRAIIKMRLGRPDDAIADFSEVLTASGEDDFDAIYGRGLSKLIRGDVAGGNADIARVEEASRGNQEVDARLAREAIARFAAMGLSPSTLAAAPPRAGAPAANPAGGPANCADAELHWKSAEAVGTVAAFQDHLARFPTCAFAGLAKMRIEKLAK